MQLKSYYNGCPSFERIILCEAQIVDKFCRDSRHIIWINLECANEAYVLLIVVTCSNGVLAQLIYFEWKLLRPWNLVQAF